MKDDSLRRFASGDDGRRHLDDDAREFRRVRSELNREWTGMTELSPIQPVREWIAFLAFVEVGYEAEWTYYGS